MNNFSLEDVAEFLGKSPDAARKLVRSGIIPAYKISGRWYVDKEIFLDWVKAEVIKLKPRDLALLDETKNRETICLSSLLRKENIIINLFSVTKSETIQKLVDHLAGVYKVKNRKALLDAVRKREMLCSTAIARGVALPHPRRVLKERINTTMMVVGISKRGVDFESEDGFLTYVLILFCAPRDDIHLRIIAKLSRLLRNYRLVMKLRSAGTAEEALRIFREAETKDAAKRKLKLAKASS